MISEILIQNLSKGLQVTAYGLAGVFSVLFLFYLLVKLMLKISLRFPEKTGEEEE